MTKQYKREVVERALRFVNTTRNFGLLEQYAQDEMTIGDVDFAVYCIGGWWLADASSITIDLPVGGLTGLLPSRSDLEMVLTGWVAEHEA